jgi:hypothetical protein
LPPMRLREAFSSVFFLLVCCFAREAKHQSRGFHRRLENALRPV